MTITSGTTLTCDNDGCGCRLLVQVPCPHGADYVCGCGHPLSPVEGTATPSTPGA